MHYVIQTDRGFELFASRKDAENSEWMAYETPLEVAAGEHYRGTPPKSGVLFHNSDQSSRQFAAILLNRR